MPRYLNHVELAVDWDIETRHGERYGTQTDNLKEKVIANMELYKLKLLSPRPVSRGEPLPVTDLFAKLKRRQQKAHSIREKTEKREKIQEARAKVREYRQRVEAVRWEDEMALRSRKAGLRADSSESRDGLIDDEEDALPDFVATDSWLTDIAVGIFDEQESFSRSYKKRFPVEGLVRHGRKGPKI